MFIDEAVAGRDGLLAALEPGVRAHLLRRGHDGLAQLRAALRERPGAASVSILAHATPARLALGAATLCDETFDPASLRAIGEACSPGASLAIYACEFGRGRTGRALVARLAAATGMAVHAASHLVGAGPRGWDLDVVSDAARSAPAPPIRAGARAAYAHTLSGAGAPPAGLPIGVSSFATLSGATFFLGGSASISGGALQLTQARNFQQGIAVYSQPLAADEALTVDFTYVSDGGSGADGLAFFLLNGDELGPSITAASIAAGESGLAYSDAGTLPGITDGYLGIGFDTYGNYSTTGGDPADNAPGRTPDTIGVRGAGSGTGGYDYLGGATYGPGIDGTHQVRIDLVPTASGFESLTILESATATGPLAEVYSTTVSQTVPGSFYFGFSGGTGSLNDLHQIDDVSVTAPVDLRLGAATVTDTTTGVVGASTPLTPGDGVSYGYTLANVGTNGDSGITVDDAPPQTIENAAWTVADSAGTHTGTFGGGTTGAIPVNLIGGAVATITVTGTLDPNATSGNADHAVSVTPGADRAFSNPADALPLTLDIGGGSSVSLLGANQTVAASDAAPVLPYAQAGHAQAGVLDTFVDPGAGLPPIDTLTVAVAPSAGALAAAGARYDAASGVLSATGSAAQLQAILDGVAFTPVAHIAAPGTTTPVTLTATVTDADPANTTGGAGSATATQTETVGVTAVHDLPTVSGGAGQGLYDTGTASPLATVAVADPDDTSLSVTVGYAGSDAGSFTAASAAGWTAAGLGTGATTYARTFADGTGSAAAAQAALRSLVFQPDAYVNTPGATATVVFSVTVEDAAAGSATDTAASVTVTATVAPPIGLALASASDSGVRGDDVTNVATPTITGTGAAGDTVTLDEGAASLGTATVGADGTWSVASSSLAGGSHTLTATESDGTGRASASSAPLVVTIDTATPAAPAGLALASDSDGGVQGDDLTNVATPTITGTGTAGDVVDLYDGASLVGTATASASGAWSVATSALADGIHGLSATETDFGGNLSPASSTLTLTLDTAAAPTPTLADTDTAGGPGEPDLSGTAAPGGTVTLHDATLVLGIAAAGASGAYTFDVSAPLTAGPHPITAVVTDPAGNVSAASAPLDITVDGDGSYAVATTAAGAAGTGDTRTRLHDASGVLTETDTTDSAGQVSERVTAASAILEVHDGAGTLIATITEPSTSASGQPTFATEARTAGAASATGTLGSQVALFSGANVLTSRGPDTVTAGSGADTVFAAGPAISVAGGAGSLLLVAGAGAATLDGGTGVATVFGGAGGGRFQGGSAGANLLVAGAGNTTLVGGGAGDILVAGSGASTLDGASGGLLLAGAGIASLVAGAGPETLYGGTGKATLHGGAGGDVLSAGTAGQTLMIGGDGATTFLGGTGAATVEGGSGNDTVFAGAGALRVTEGGGADQVLFGSGAATIAGGTGTDLYDFISGKAGGTATIAGFKAGPDRIDLFGYALSAVRTQTASGNITLTLPDQTRITLLGVTALAANSVV